MTGSTGNWPRHTRNTRRRNTAYKYLTLVTWALVGVNIWLVVSSRPEPRLVPASQPYLSRTSRVTVYRVIDGDTLQLSSREKIRLATINAPEMSDADGKASRQALLKLVQGQVLTVEREGFDPYGRTLARLYLPDGREVGAVMIEKKMATPWPEW